MESWLCLMAVPVMRCRYLGRSWAATVVCLGHCQRKRRDFTGALRSYRWALALEPGCASTRAAEAFTRHLAGDLAGAIDGYHQALAVQPGHAFANDLLAVAVEQHAREDVFSAV